MRENMNVGFSKSFKKNGDMGFWWKPLPLVDLIHQNVFVFVFKLP